MLICGSQVIFYFAEVICPKNGWTVHRWVGPKPLVAEWERVRVCTSVKDIAGDMGSDCREDTAAVDEIDD